MHLWKLIGPCRSKANSIIIIISSINQNDHGIITIALLIVWLGDDILEEPWKCFQAHNKEICFFLHLSNKIHFLQNTQTFSHTLTYTQTERTTPTLTQTHLPTHTHTQLYTRCL